MLNMKIENCYNNLGVSYNISNGTREEALWKAKIVGKQVALQRQAWKQPWW